MRLSLAIAALAVVFSADAIAQTVLIGQRDVARPGGVYASLTTRDAAQCAQLCAEDGICLAWTYREAQASACELKAVAPDAVAELGAISGLSSRAPDFTRRLARATAVTLPSLQPDAEAAPEETIVAMQLDDNDELLGGPGAHAEAEPADMGLRLRGELQ